MARRIKGGNEKEGALEAAQGAPRDPRRDSRGERSPWLPLETRPDSPGRSALEKDPRPGPLFEGNPVGEGTTRRGTATPVHHEGAVTPQCIIQKNPQGLHTARQGA